ncbi:hypothetical protein [Sulfitobacter sp. THAF37]|uniref:hypothetical protein n=1 Tax=Sulfitobacter sp. THAF37 TaxID=2587855 RepID=UPI001C12B34B|nr:hypothetical protein [Sulfitobacter sp. THAF37]
MEWTLAVLRQVCDQTFVMCKGETVKQGLVEQVFANPPRPCTRELAAAAGETTADVAGVG